MTVGTEVTPKPEMADFLPAGLPELPASVEEEVASARERAESIVIDSEESARVALEFVKTVKRRAKEIEAERVSLTKPRNDAAKEIKRVYDGMKAPFVEVEGILQKAIGDWRRVEEAKAREAQRRIDEERARVEVEAREKREAAERAQREADELAEEADNDEDAAVAGDLAEEARRDAERAGVTEQAIGSLPPQAPAAAPKLDGFSTRTKREAFVTDRSQLPDTLPDGTPLVIVDMVALRRWMNQQWTATGEAPTLPGAEFKRVPDGEAVRT